MKKNYRITCYTLNNLKYAVFFVTGFFENAKILGYDFVLSGKIPPSFEKEFFNQEYREILFAMCLLKVSDEKTGKEFYCCIDTHDISTLSKEQYKGYHIPLLKKVKFYFKVNYNKSAIEADPVLKEFFRKIHPASPFFPIKSSNFFQRFSLVLQSAIAARTLIDILKIGKYASLALTLAQVKEMRNLDKQMDVFFVMVYYENKIHSPENEFRYQIMKELRSSPGINSTLGFVCKKPLPGKFSEFLARSYSPEEYMNCVARSKVVIYVRGLHDCLSFKLAERLALGLPIIGQPHRNNREGMMEHKYFDEQFAYESPKEIVDKVSQVLKDPAKLDLLSESNAKVFDENFTPKAAVFEILKKII